MTQKMLTRPYFTVIGKDRLMDPWVTFNSEDVEKALDWAERRAFLLPDEHGNTVREVR